MSASFIGSRLLATGQTVPFTGAWVNITEARNAMFVVYGSGISSPLTVNLEAKTSLQGQDAVFSDTGVQVAVPMYSFTGVSNGYYSPVFLDSPVAFVRVSIPTGSAGKIWSYASIQN